MLTGRTILVTGGAGLIGSRLVPVLLRQGARVLVVDRKSPEQTACTDNRLEYYQCDLCDSEALRQLASRSFQKVEQLVHLAASMSNQPTTNPHAVLEFEREMGGTLLLLNSLPPLRAICFASSIMVYGPARQALIDENHPTEPENSYGTLKLTVENVLRLYGRQTECRVAILRLCGLYGGTLEGPRAIPAFVRAVLRDEPPVVSGGAVRDYIYIDDAIEALSLAITQQVCGVFNIGSGTGTATLNLAEAVIRATAKPLVPLRRAGTASLASCASMVFDVCKARQDLGFECRYSLDRGLKALVAEALSRGEN